jgi:hypothetical protein
MDALRCGLKVGHRWRIQRAKDLISECGGQLALSAASFISTQTPLPKQKNTDNDQASRHIIRCF